MKEKGRQREKDSQSSGSGVPAKRRLGKLDLGQAGQRHLWLPDSQDLATRGDGWTHGPSLREPSSVWSLLFADQGGQKTKGGR